jgi:hypothetical protein
MSNFKNHLLIVNLNISAWEARKQDKKATQEVAASHAVRSTVGRYHKDLLPDAPEHANILKIRNAWRVWHYENTLPWGDDAGRVIRSLDYLDYAQAYNDFKRQWDSAVTAFVAVYPTLVAQAELHLNTLFNASDYPSEDDVKGRFNVRMNSYPLPNEDDFRILEGIPPEEAEALRQSAVEGMQECLGTAIKDVWKRMYAVVSAMQARLEVPIGDKGGKFHDSLVDNIADLVLLMPNLNLLNDPEITTMSSAMKLLTKYPAETLRASPEARSATAERARSLAEKMGKYCG